MVTVKMGNKNAEEKVVKRATKAKKMWRILDDDDDDDDNVKEEEIDKKSESGDGDDNDNDPLCTTEFVTPMGADRVQWSGGMGVRGLLQSLWNLPEDEEDRLEEMEELMEVFEEMTEMELLTCEYGGRWDQSHATRVLGRFRRIVQGNEKPTDMRYICAFLMKHQKHVEDLL